MAKRGRKPLSLEVRIARLEAQLAELRKQLPKDDRFEYGKEEVNSPLEVKVEGETTG